MMPRTTHMLVKSYIDHVENSIRMALNHQSFIDVEILQIPGFSTGVQRRLWSNLCHLEKPELTYCEIGLFGGATFCAAMNNNPSLHAIGVEDGSQEFGDATIRRHLAENLQRYGDDAASCKVYDADFFSMDINQIDREINIFYYDGEHSREAQAKALPTIFPKLAKDFIFLVDDYNWQSSNLGTADGFRELDGKLTQHKSWALSDAKRQDGENWHNGVFIGVFSKL